MNFIEVVLLAIGLLLLGPFLNFAIYSFAYFPRQISPWQRPIENLPRRTMAHRLPVVGWFSRHRLETETFGILYRLRPFLIEVGTPIALICLYRACMSGMFVPMSMPPVSSVTCQHQFMAYAILISLMVVATFIDFDERTIPDLVTIPGTLMGLLGSVILPDWRLHEWIPPIFPAVTSVATPINAGSPFGWDPAWHGSTGIGLALLFWSGWCFGMSDRRWIGRRGFSKGLAYFVERLKRNPGTRWLIGLWVGGVGCLFVAYVALAGGQRWEALLSSLFGIGLGGLLVWGFRLVAGWAMGQEALGFGDVTLMAMIGSFFGWQIVWIAFFLAPIFGLVFVIGSWLITGDNATPFGPYLCAATLYVMLDWARMWSWCSELFLPPIIILPILVGLLMMLGGLLWMIQLLKSLFASG
jgi:leader peptidase (prepilin peptidase) / N-methyltransferase